MSPPSPWPIWCLRRVKDRVLANSIRRYRAHAPLPIRLAADGRAGRHKRRARVDVSGHGSSV